MLSLILNGEGRINHASGDPNLAARKVGGPFLSKDTFGPYKTRKYKLSLSFILLFSLFLPSLGAPFKMAHTD